MRDRFRLEPASRSSASVVASAQAIGWAGATGVCIALYTVIDAQGVRAAPNALSYIVWIFILLGGGMAVLFALWRGPRFIVAARSEWRAGLFAGAMSIVTYGLAFPAYRLGDTPRLAALRETSIVFAALIAIFVLKERVTAMRLGGIGLISAGAGVLLDPPAETDQTSAVERHSWRLGLAAVSNFSADDAVRTIHRRTPDRRDVT